MPDQPIIDDVMGNEMDPDDCVGEDAEIMNSNDERDGSNHCGHRQFRGRPFDGGGTRLSVHDRLDGCGVAGPLS